MKVLVACEYSGIVRDAFRARGHDAMSCDLLPTDSDGPHYQGDVRDVLGNGWDLMIAHPPCTHLSVSGARWFPQKRADGRQQSAMEFFMLLATAPISKIAVENPVGIMSTHYMKPTQVIQPWWFGHPEFKATCFWLKNLPPLVATNKLVPPTKDSEDWKSWNRVHKCPPGPLRAKLRSWRYPNIAAAMAEQWGNI
jgi:site-specific DNA-cytosine methylase